ncbi:MAG: lysylphosphatidylglycerol synthase transmembrane domain-containing protein [Victivallales bacterium]|nr:lysylphosphatidylglycerol synthase transmembrane domain-containing protein [Victivallales bacterium]
MANNGSRRQYAPKVVWYIFQLALGAGLIYYLFHDKMSDIIHNLDHFRFIWLVPAVCLYYLLLFVGAWRWYLLARVLNFRLTLWDAVSLTMKAFFCSLVIPGGAIGGDLVKIGFLAGHAAKGTKVEGAFTVLMDRIVGMIALFVLAIILTLVSIPLLMSINAPELYAMCGLSHDPQLIYRGKCLLIVGILALCLAGLAACFVMFMHRQLEKIPLIRWGINLANRISHGSFARTTAAIDIYRHNPRLVFNTVIISVFLVHLNLVAVVFCLAMGLGVKIVKPLALVTGVILGNIAGLIPFTPSGVGFRDYTIIKFVEACGATGTQAGATALFFTSLIIFANISCGIFFLLGRRSSRRGE